MTDDKALEKVFQIPAVYVNCWHAYATGEMFRLTFGEAPPGIARFTTAVTLTRRDALRLAEEIMNVHKESFRQGSLITPIVQ